MLECNSLPSFARCMKNALKHFLFIFNILLIIGVTGLYTNLYAVGLIPQSSNNLNDGQSECSSALPLMADLVVYDNSSKGLDKSYFVEVAEVEEHEGNGEKLDALSSKNTLGGFYTAFFYGQNLESYSNLSLAAPYYYESTNAATNFNRYLRFEVFRI